MMMDYIKEMPVDVISNIVSYCVGNPELIKLKYNQELKELVNNKFKITTSETNTIKHKVYSTRVNQTISKYKISREKPFKLNSLERIIKQQRHELLYLIYDTVEDNPDFEAHLMVRIKGTESYPHAEENDALLIPAFFDEVKGDNIDTALEVLCKDLQENIAVKNELYSARGEVNEIVGFKTVEFRIRITEN